MDMRTSSILFPLILLLLLLDLTPPHQAGYGGVTGQKLKKKDLLKYLMYLKAIKGGKKKIIPLPIPIFVLPFVLKAAKKKSNKEAEFYLVKPHLKPREFVRKYIKMNGGYQSLYY